MPRPELQEFARTFAEHQRQSGYPAPIVASTFEEAMRALSIDDAAHFALVTDELEN